MLFQTGYLDWRCSELQMVLNNKAADGKINDCFKAFTPIVFRQSGIIFAP